MESKNLLDDIVRSSKILLLSSSLVSSSSSPSPLVSSSSPSLVSSSSPPLVSSSSSPPPRPPPPRPPPPRPPPPSPSPSPSPSRRSSFIKKQSSPPPSQLQPQAQTFGRECKLGWGYNESLDRVIPVEGQLSMDKSELNQYKLTKNVYPLSSDNLPYHANIFKEVLSSPSIILEKSWKKYFDFQLVFENKEYWISHQYVERRRDECRKLPKYPSNCSHYINRIDYGVELWIIFPQSEFLKEEKQVGTLFTSKTLNNENKTIKCKVLINYNETKEMTLGELVDLIGLCEKGDQAEPDIPLWFGFEKLSDNFRGTVINNKDGFMRFLSALYCVYRKIELKLEKAGYPRIVADVESDENSFVKICADLNKTKEIFNNLKIKTNNFFELYPILKNLFYCYSDYINYSVEHGSDMDEGDYLPETVDELESWFRELNKWIPTEVNGEWRNCMNPFIGTPSGFEQVVERLHKIPKFENYTVINDDETTEPYIREEENRKILFGFVDMQGAEADETSTNLNILELECPEECTEDLRKWICTTCGEFISIKLHVVKWQFLICSCGSKKYKDKFFICHHPSHRQPKKEKKQNKKEIFHPSVSETETDQCQLNNNDDVLSKIHQQLYKIRNKNGEATNPKIFIALVDLQSKNKNKEEIKAILKSLQDLTLDGDTNHLIRQYLDENDSTNV